MSALPARWRCRAAWRTRSGWSSGRGTGSASATPATSPATPGTNSSAATTRVSVTNILTSTYFLSPILPRVSLIGAKTWWSCKVVSFNPSQIGHLTLAHGSIFLLRDIYFEAIVEGKRWHPKLVVIIVNFWYKLLWNEMTKIPYFAHQYVALWHTDTLSVANSKIAHPCTRHFPRWWTEAVRTVGAEDRSSSSL